MKKKIAIAIPFLLLIGYACVLTVLTLRTKIQYESLVQEYKPSVVIEMSSDHKAQFIEEISTMQSHEVGSLTEEEKAIFSASNIPNNTQGFVYLLSSEPPSYHLWRMNKNRVNSQIMVLRSIIGPTLNPRGRLYVENENSDIIRAFSRSHNNSIIETRDLVEGGFVHILHYFPTDQPGVDPDGGINSESLRSSP